MELADIVARIESSGNQWAQRFEKLHQGASGPELIARIVASHNNAISNPTADIYAAMSHGLYQIMGFRLWGDPTKDARNLGFRAPLWTFMQSPTIQRSYFDLYCRRSNVAFTVDELRTDATKVAAFARVYNGSGNVAAYSQKVYRTIAELDRARA